MSDYCGIRLVLKPDARVENVLGALNLLAKGATPVIQTFRQEAHHPPEGSTFAYRGVHVDVVLAAHIPSKSLPIRVEIQARTIFEDIWATCYHEHYKADRKDSR